MITFTGLAGWLFLDCLVMILCPLSPRFELPMEFNREGDKSCKVQQPGYHRRTSEVLEQQRATEVNGPTGGRSGLPCPSGGRFSKIGQNK